MSRQEIDKLVIEHCRATIEQKLKWGASDTWTHSDYQTLSEAILQQTGVSLSHNTLKRIWGKVKYDSSPTKATKDAIAVFAGYQHFEDARTQWMASNPAQFVDQEQTMTDQNIPIKQELATSRLGAFIGSLIMVGVLALVFHAILNDRKADVSVVFKALNGSAMTWPHTVNFNTDFSEVETDTLIINYHDQVRMKAHRDVKQLNYTYYMPNFYKARVFDGSDCLATQNIHIKSNGWVALGPLDTTLSYLPHTVNDTINDGRLFVSTEQFSSKRQLLPEYYISYRLVDDFDLNLEEIDLTFDVKNDSHEGGLPCHDVRLRVLGQESPLELMMLNQGCVDKAHFMIDGKGLNGRTADMRSFGHDFSKWQKVNIRAAKDKFIASVADTSIGQLPISKPLGRIKGLIFWFKGTGSLQNVVLKNAKSGALVYKSDFK